MKLFLIGCLFALAALASATDEDTSSDENPLPDPSNGENLHPRGCIYALGTCQRDCEEGTHGYATGCGHMTPEATCDNPNPVEDKSSTICDFSACYCDPPTVRDTVSNKCVRLEDCPKKE